MRGRSTGSTGSSLMSTPSTTSGWQTVFATFTTNGLGSRSVDALSCRDGNEKGPPRSRLAGLA
jgi:hypothetical protein